MVVPGTLMKYLTKLDKSNFCIIPKSRLGVRYQNAFANLSPSLFPSSRNRKGCPVRHPSSHCAERAPLLPAKEALHKAQEVLASESSEKP